MTPELVEKIKALVAKLEEADAELVEVCKGIERAKRLDFFNGTDGVGDAIGYLERMIEPC